MSWVSKEVGGGGGLELLRAGYVLASTEAIVRAAIGKIKADQPDEAGRFREYYVGMKGMGYDATGTFADPGQDRDVLYGADGKLIRRELRPEARRTRVWYGPIGSGDKLVRDARKRDELRDMYGLIGLEMEAAGTMNHIRVGVIRGVCDYGDERKNKEWQRYAAAMAAAYAKAVLREIFVAPGRNPAVASPVRSGHEPGLRGPSQFVFNGPVVGKTVQTGLSFSGPTTFTFS